MKKILKNFIIVLFIFLGINNVSAANYLTSFKLELEKSEYFNSIKNSEIVDDISMYSSADEHGNNVLHLDLIMEGQTYTTEYTFNNETSVMTYSKVGSKQYDIIYNDILLNYFIKEKKYNAQKFYTYIYTNDDLTLEKDGIEYSFGEMYTEEEMQQIMKDWQEYWESLTPEEQNELEGIGFGNPEIFTKLKLDFKNGLKTYDESLIPFYYFENEKQEFEISKDKNLTFKIDAEFELFDKIYIDDKEVEKSNYTAKSGSTIITFNDEYTKKLSEGKHAIKVTFTDGEFAITEFTIKQAVKNPDTGITFGYGILISTILMSFIAYILVRKQSKFLKHN